MSLLPNLHPRISFPSKVRSNTSLTDTTLLSKSQVKHMNQYQKVNMRQAQVTEWGQPPKTVDAPEPPAPSENEIRIKVIAAGLHQVVKSRASGKHYSSGELPHVPGVDGVGTTDDGKTVYFSSFAVGSMSEYVNMPKHSVIPLPEGLDPVQVAGITNPALSSWAALKLRTSNLPKDFSVLIVGATSASGRVAVHLAKTLGAKRIVAAARNQAALESLGVDEIIVTADEPEKTDFSAVGEVDVILDYVYGPLAIHLLSSIKAVKPVDYIHIGALSGQMEINLPGAILRSKNVSLKGSGPGAWDPRELSKIMPELLTALKNVPPQPVRTAKLEGVEKEWASTGSERLVFVM